MKNLIFLCIATCIFIFSLIVLNFAPSINGLVGKGHYSLWGSPVADNDNTNQDLYFGFADYPCSRYTDRYNDIKDGVRTFTGAQEDKDKFLDQLKDGKNDCLRKKAYIGLEYSAFIIDVIFSFVCAILGLLLYSGNNIGKILGLIGLASGAVGFVLTFVYIIYSGIVFNNDVIGKNYWSTSINPYSGLDLATTSNGAVLEWKDNKYVCIFYDKDNKDKLYRKYSNYGLKYINYFHLNGKDKDDEYYKYNYCITGMGTQSINWENCKKFDEGSLAFSTNKIEIIDNGNKKGDCDKIYVNEYSGTNEKKKLYDYWVLTIVFGCFIFVLDIGLAIFGFLIFKDNGTSGAVSIK